MTLTAHDTWSRLLDRARQELPEQTFKTWLEPTEALSLEGETMLVGCPDQFAADWNESKHSDLLGNLAAVALGHPIRVVFRVTEERKARPQMDLFVAPPAPQTQQTRAAVAPPLRDRSSSQDFRSGTSSEL